MITTREKRSPFWLMIVIGCVGLLLATTNPAAASSLATERIMAQHHRHQSTVAELSQRALTRFRTAQATTTRKLRLVRKLQDDEEADDDATICASLLALTYRTKYEQQKNPCTCSRDAEANSFQVDCGYEYCEECVEETGTCAYQYSTDVFTPETNYVRGTYCVDFTAGPQQGQKTCFTFGPDPSSEQGPLFCQVSVDDQQCDSCQYVPCNNNVEIEFDCTTLGFGRANICTATEVDFELDSPMVAFRKDVLTFDSCYVEPDDEVVEEDEETCDPKCPIHLTCVGGKCRGCSPPCSKEDGLVCRNRQCVADPDNDGPRDEPEDDTCNPACPVHLTCVEGKCRGCDPHCVSPRVCRNRQCVDLDEDDPPPQSLDIVPTCDSECPVHLTCVDGRCLGCHPPCSKQEGLVCRNRQCVTL